MTERELAKKWAEINDLYEIESYNLKAFMEEHKNNLNDPLIAREKLEREKKIIELKSKANIAMASIYNLSFNTLKAKNDEENKKSR